MEVDQFRTNYLFVQYIRNERKFPTSWKKYMVRDGRAAVHHFNGEGKVTTTEVFRLEDGRWIRNRWVNPDVVQAPESR
jgi:hypothetical protein